MPTTMTLLLVTALGAGTADIEAAAATGDVTLPLTYWTDLVHTLSPDEDNGKPPPVAIASIERTLDGTFRKGLLHATLVTRFEVFEADGHIRVPIIADDASPSRVRLDGKPTSLVKVGGMYTVGVDKPGTYEVEVGFYHGQEQDRFSRRLQVQLPPGGVTLMSILVPEPNISAQLENGTLTAHQGRPDGTLLQGYLDASGSIDLSWNRTVTHQDSTRVTVKSRLDTLFTVHEALITGVAVFDIQVLDGETARFALVLPPELEITKVTGDAVLQWRSDTDALTVLLRYLVSDRTRIAVHFQYANDLSKNTPLRMPLPARGVEMTGAVGVQAPAGLQVKVADAVDANALTLRELPSELTALTDSPLLFGFSFVSAPTIALSVSRLQQVEMTSTLIDEVEASTVLIEDGTEITKMKLHIRNNTRQYLQVRLAKNEVLTHALIDGQPVRPALTHDERGTALLFSLRQSERVDPDVGRTHRVRRGETLGDLAIAYYSDPGKWTLILDENRDQLSSETSVRVGQVLRIPSAGPVTVEESSFILELAYRRKGASLGMFGVTDIELPELDVEAMKVTWHVYLPKSLTPLRFDANLTQYSRIRYGTFRRLLRFLDEALDSRHAWAAGEPKYKSILEQRRTIYQSEVERKGVGEVSPGSFPLVGERYRFKRILVDRDQPSISIVYASNGTISAIRWLGFLSAFAIGMVMFRPRRRWWRWVIPAIGFPLLLIVGHYVLGIHKRLLWGVDVALLVSIARLGFGDVHTRFKDLAWSPWHVVRLFTWRNLYFIIALTLILHIALKYPLLLSIVTLVTGLGLWQRLNARYGKEGAHVSA